MDRSTYAGAAGGAVSVLAVWIIKTFAHVDVPAEVGMAFSTLVTIALVHFVPDKTAA